MKDRNRDSPALMLLLLLAVFIQAGYPQSFEGGWYRLTTQWLGEEKALDVVNDGANNRLQMATTANRSGQFWKITSLGNGYFRLTSQWQGDGRSLDVVNDGTNNKLQLAKTDNVSGQFWKITSLGNGYYRLTTQWQGDGKSLDVVNDTSKSNLQLAKTENVSGQFWKISKISSDAPPPDKKRVFSETTLSGFRILFDPARRESAEMKETFRILAEKLEEIAKIVKPKHLAGLKKVPVWIEYINKTDGAVWYHPDKNWLVSNGYPAEMERSVEIKSMRNFIDWQADQPYMVLHEFAHAHQDLFAADLQSRVAAAYDAALASGKYESVPYVRGGKQRAYAMNNKVEYFAELTEAYFGKNDYYPFTREDLKTFDPAGYKIMQEAWD